MVKVKKKTQVSAYVSQELGEWVRETAYKSRVSQGITVKVALYLLKSLKETDRTKLLKNFDRVYKKNKARAISLLLKELRKKHK